MLAAVCVGNELVCRLGLSIRWKFDWHITPLFGVFGAALSCSKLLGFDREKIVHSLGIALSQACVTMEVGYSPGSELRGMYAAFPAKNAVLAGLMADIGIGGRVNSLEGQAGLYNVYFDGKYNRDALVEEFGTKFEFAGTGIKLWPNCRNPQPHVDAAIGLVEENKIRPADIKEVTVHVAGLAERGSFPLEQWRRPSSTLDAKFSVPFSVAVALIRNRLGIRDFTPKGIKDPAVLEMANKINARHEPKFEKKCTAPGQVDIATNDGKMYTKKVDFPRGHPKNPATDEEVIAKFKECTGFSARPIGESKIDEAIDMVMNMEKVANLGETMALLS